MLSGLWVCVLFVLGAVLILRLYNQYTTGVCDCQVCLLGKTAIITGANTGIGYETALDFAKRGAKVILGCRNEAKAQEAVGNIIKETKNNNVHYVLVNFASFESVRKFAKHILDTEERLDILVNNAGTAGLGNKLTEDGIPIVFQINYLSHFLLTNLLLDLLLKNPSRVVNVSSTFASAKGKLNMNNLTEYKGSYQQYHTSKLCLILFTIELARRFCNTNLTAYSLHPGLIQTNLVMKPRNRNQFLVYLFSKVSSKTVREGAQTQIHCAIANGLEKYNGEHFHDCHPVPRYKTVHPELGKPLWEESERIVGLRK